MQDLLMQTRELGCRLDGQLVPQQVAAALELLDRRRALARLGIQPGQPRVRLFEQWVTLHQLLRSLNRQRVAIGCDQALDDLDKAMLIELAETSALAQQPELNLGSIG